MRLAVLYALVLVAAAPGAVARPAVGPTNTAAPTIVGVARVNGSVSSTPGTWVTGAGTITYGYMWQQCDPQGASCSFLPYTSPSIAQLQAVVGQTIRVLVTATDATGSAQAVSAPVVVQGANTSSGGGGGGSTKLTVSIVSPKPGSTVTTRRFTLVVKAAGPGTLRVTVEGLNLPSRSKHGPAGLFRFPITYPDARRATFSVTVSGGGNSKEKDFALIIQPPMRVIQEFDERAAAPGCRTCVIRDPAGDDLGSPPDIKTATSTFAGGWIVHTITTFGPVRGVRTPCIAGYALVGPRWSGFSVGCAAGIIEGNACRHATCGPLETSYPNAHTVRYRFRPAQIGSPPAYLWDVWVLYHGDNLKDAAPSLSGRLPEPNASWHYCLVREQLRTQIPDGVYRFGRGVCTQSAVVSGKP